jgi:hypothetical protein
MHKLAQLVAHSKKAIAALLLSAIVLIMLPQPVNAASISTMPLNNNLATGIPANQHTLIQSIFLEMADGLICQLTGTDLLSPKTGCLNINTLTHKIGYNTTNQGINNGLIGFVSQGIVSMYTPPASVTQYTQYLSENFGVVHSAEAASTTDGIKSISSLLDLWKVSRDVSYTVFVIAFIFIGLGIMLRIKIDPRTVMTIQNQIPKIVIAILLITFSFAISGLMIDAMWITTYVGINVLTSTPTTGSIINNGTPLSKSATDNLYWTPISYVDTIFDTGGNLGNHGLFSLTNNISGAMAGLLGDIISQALGSGNCSFIPLDLSGCIGNVIIAPLAHIILWIIIFITLIVALFRVWFELLKAYMFILIYIITGPLWIVASLLPGSPLGFGKWIRSLFVNVTVFPVTVIMFIFARIITEILNKAPDPTTTFIPPLIGNPTMQNFGTLGALGVILMAPTMLTILRESLKVPGTKHGSAIAQGLSLGAAAPGAFTNRAWGNLTRVNANTGEATGLVSAPIQRFQSKLVKSIPGIGQWAYQQRTQGWSDAGKNVKSIQEERAAKKVQTKTATTSSTPPAQSAPASSLEQNLRAERQSSPTRMQPPAGHTTTDSGIIVPNSTKKNPPSGGTGGSKKA